MKTPTVTGTSLTRHYIYSNAEINTLHELPWVYGKKKSYPQKAHLTNSSSFFLKNRLELCMCFLCQHKYNVASLYCSLTQISRYLRWHHCCVSSYWVLLLFYLSQDWNVACWLTLMTFFLSWSIYGKLFKSKESFVWCYITVAWLFNVINSEQTYPSAISRISHLTAKFKLCVTLYCTYLIRHKPDDLVNNFILSTQRKNVQIIFVGYTK